MSLLTQINLLDASLRNSGDYQAIADTVNSGRTKVVTRLGGIGLVLETLGPVDGAALLDTLQGMTAAMPALKWAWYLIERGELDFGSAATRAMIDQLVLGGAMPEAVGAALKGVAEVPDTVTAAECEVAMKNPDGSAK